MQSYFEWDSQNKCFFFVCVCVLYVLLVTEHYTDFLNVKLDSLDSYYQHELLF